MFNFWITFENLGQILKRINEILKISDYMLKILDEILKILGEFERVLRAALSVHRGKLSAFNEENSSRRWDGDLHIYRVYKRMETDFSQAT